MSDPVGLCLSGAISPEVALVRLLVEGTTAERIAALVAAARPEPPDARWLALSRLVEERADTLRDLAREIRASGGDHAIATGGADDLARVAAFFDRAVAHSPEASVALHSLGDPGRLEAATGEIVDWLGARGLLGRDADVLDLGCGIGRVAARLAPLCRSVLGLDVSAGMVAEARRRCASLSHLRFERTEGRDLEGVDGPFDLVLAVDSFPYMVQAGVAEAHVAGAARRLRTGGALAILNLSYRGDDGADRADLLRWAGAHGLEVTLAGARPFRIWDGTAALLVRRG